MTDVPLRLNLSEGSVSFGFTREAALALKASLHELIEALKSATSGSASGSSEERTRQRPSAQKPMEYRYTGDVFLEVFCNPNIWPSPFAAKVLLTVRDERIRLNTEADLTRLLDDVSQYLEQFG